MNTIIESIVIIMNFITENPIILISIVIWMLFTAIRVFTNIMSTDDYEYNHQNNYEQPKQESQQEQKPEIKIVVKEVVKEVEKPQPKPIKDIKVKKIECSYCGASLEHNGTCKYCGTKHQIIKKY